MTFSLGACARVSYMSALATSAPTPAPASSATRGPRGGGAVPNFSAPAASRSRAHVMARAHPNSPRSRRNPKPDDLVTPQGRYPSAWATDLADIFGWDDVLAASGVGERDGDEATAAARVLLPKRIALDGANIAWSLGTSVRSRFKCRQFPLSAGVIQALHYEPWRAKNYDVVAFLPKEYVVGGLQTLCDGGGRATLNAECVKYVGKGVWVNTRLMDLVDAGSIVMVERGPASANGRASDDLTIIEYAKERDAWICSNDQFRDHRRNKGLGFSGARDLKAFARMRRFEHAFRVAPGLDDELLQSMLAANGWNPKIGWKEAVTVAGDPVPPPRPRGRAAATDARNAAEAEAMGAVMDSLLSGPDAADSPASESARSAPCTTSGSDTTRDTAVATASEVYYDGPRTRNDNENALGGVFPFYAAPQDAVPVFFEPAPTTPMIAARKSFLRRQGWSVQTVTGGKATT